jgi:hypothetical protein
MPTSASVMVTYWTRSIAEMHELELPVLWRGTPGWFLSGSGESSGGGRSGRGRWSERFSRGGHEFEIDGDSSARTADVLGKTFDLTKGDVRPKNLGSLK